MQTWHDTRIAYEAAELARRPALDRALWEIVADDLERLCGPATVGDVDEALLERFTASLVSEGVDFASLAIYRDVLHQALAWAVMRRVAEAA